MHLHHFAVPALPVADTNVFGQRKYSLGSKFREEFIDNIRRSDFRSNLIQCKALEGMDIELDAHR